MTKTINRRSALTLFAGAGATTFLGTAAAGAAAPAKLDLMPILTVSGMKAEGYAGAVALRLKNVGTDRYYGNFPMVSFKVEIKTAEGPQGVDRLVTPGWFNGAYSRDLGFDEQTGTRTFMVTLANPLKAGQTQLVANFNFGDGLTSEGRISNYIVITQVGRIAGDTSTGNDQAVDSRAVTRTDTGDKHSGLF